MKINKKGNNIETFFFDWYPLIFGICIGAVFVVLQANGIVNFLSVENFNDVLNAVMSFVSILIGLISLLITTVLVNEKNSTIVDSFLDVVGRNRFYKATRANIVTGVFTAFFSVLLYFKQIFFPTINLFFFSLWVVSLMSFFLFTIKFTDLLLQLLILKPKEKEKRTKTTSRRTDEAVKEIQNSDSKDDCTIY